MIPAVVILSCQAVFITCGITNYVIQLIFFVLIILAYMKNIRDFICKIYVCLLTGGIRNGRKD